MEAEEGGGGGGGGGGTTTTTSPNTTQQPLTVYINYQQSHFTQLYNQYQHLTTQTINPQGLQFNQFAFTMNYDNF